MQIYNNVQVDPADIAANLIGSCNHNTRPRIGRTRPPFANFRRSSECSVFELFSYRSIIYMESLSGMIQSSLNFSLYLLQVNKPLFSWRTKEDVVECNSNYVVFLLHNQRGLIIWKHELSWGCVCCHRLKKSTRSWQSSIARVLQGAHWPQKLRTTYYYTCIFLHRCTLKFTPREGIRH